MSNGHPTLELKMMAGVQVIAEEFAWIRQSLDGHANWAMLVDAGAGPWDHITGVQDEQVMRFKLLDGSLLRATPAAISFAVDISNVQLWRNSLMRAARRLRTWLHDIDHCSMGENAMLLLRRNSAILVKKHIPGLAQKPHLYITAPGTPGHDLLEAQNALEQDFPGMFRIV